VTADELAEKIAFDMLGKDAAEAAWGIEIEEVRVGYARIRMRVRRDMLNGHGTAHGAMTFALADTAFAYACNGRNTRTVGAQASMIYLDAAREGDVLIAEAQEASLVGRNGVYNVAVRTEDGRAIAEFQGYSRSVGGPLIEIGDSE
jgi:acyl-CoA thioesterase